MLLVDNVEIVLGGHTHIRMKKVVKCLNKDETNNKYNTLHVLVPVVF